MDHLPLPAGVEKYPYEIPVLCTEEYDDLGFWTYPERKGYDINQLRRGELKGLQDLPQFLQTWLYFGLLSEVLSIKISYKDFTEDGKLTTAPLSRHIDEWKTQIDELEAEAKVAERDKVHALLVESTRIGRWLTPVNGELPIPPEITLSMQVLVSTLQGAAFWIWQTGARDFSRELNEWGNSGLVMWRMHGRGWCPNFLNKCFRKTNVTTMAYISMLDRPDGADHSKCDWDNCGAFNVVTSEYKTKHCTEGCDCPFLDVPITEIRDIVRKGAVPGLSLENGCVVVREVEDFVAISHVWKDGLGNVGHNSLPKCQLEMLMAKVSEVGGSHFWIDTICVPVERELKAAALRSMEHIYRDAQVVLVLDAGLRKASCKNSQVEALIRIFTCGWLTRLWTFQEGALAGSHRLKVVFADGVVSADFDAIDRLRLSYLTAESWDVARDMLVSEIPLSTLSLLRVHEDPELMPESNFGQRIMSLWLGCRDRLLTNPGDEYIVFATMLGLDPGRLYLLESPERMVGLLRMQEEWPHTFLFADGPRLRTPGYQWAPSCFLQSWPGQPGNPAENARLGVRTNSGLVVKRRGFIFAETEAECMLKTFFCKDEESGKWHFLRFQNDANPEDVPAWEQLSPRKGMRTGILIADRRAVDASQWALLVTITKEEDSILYADFGCRLVIGICSDSDLVRWAEMLAPWARPSDAEAEEQKLWPEQQCWETYGRIRKCTDDQMWCIG